MVIRKSIVAAAVVLVATSVGSCSGDGASPTTTARIDYVAGAIEDFSLNDDALARDIRTGDVAAEIILEYIEACLIWN